MSSQQTCLKLCCASKASCAPHRAFWGERSVLCCGFLLFPLGSRSLAPFWEPGLLRVPLLVRGSTEDCPVALEWALPNSVMGKLVLRVLTEQCHQMENV